ncbi:oligosaccharide flippase family protein [Vagococcus elongatus]
MLLFSVFFFGSDLLAYLMGDHQLAPLIKVSAGLFLFVPVLAVYRGFFQGELRLEPTAFSQLLEQIVRVAVIILSAVLFQKGWLGIYQTGALASFGAIFGAFAAMIILFFYGKSEKIHICFSPRREGKILSSHLFKRFLVEGGIICSYSALLVLFQLVDSFVLKNGLVFGGMEEVLAKTIKGAYDRGQPLAQVGLVISSAFATSHLPRLTLLRENKNITSYQATFQRLMKVVVVIGSAAAVGLSMLLPELNRGLFGDGKENVSISLFMGVVFLLSVIQVLQIIGQTKHSYKLLLRAFFYGLIAKVILSFPLTYLYGTVGASVSTLLGLTLTYAVLYRQLYRKEVGKKSRYLWQLLFSLSMMCIGIQMYRWLWRLLMLENDSRVMSLLFSLSGAVVGLGVFLFSIIIIGLFEQEEWKMLPFGERFADFKLKKVTQMRLDKFLKVSRLIKRRTVAKEVADKGRITINGQVAKSSSKVAVDDQLSILFGNKTLVVKVLALHESTKKEDAAKMYEVIEETKAAE